MLFDFRLMSWSLMRREMSEVRTYLPSMIMDIRFCSPPVHSNQQMMFVTIDEVDLFDLPFAQPDLSQTASNTLVAS